MSDDILLPNELDTSLFTQPTEYVDPLHLDLENDEFVKVIRKSIERSVKFYTDKNLYDRQRKMVEYYLGQQKKSKNAEYKENIIYEGLSRVKPIALSRMPDLIVKSGDETPESKESAEKLSGIFNSDLRKRANRKLFGLAHKLEPLYFFAATKARWNPEKGPYGDYEFINVHPTNIVFDHVSSTNDANQMRFVAEKAEMTVKETIMMFPDKEEQIKIMFGWDEDEGDSESKLASPINVWEVWFHWYKSTSDEFGGKKWERVDGVVWLYKDLVLKKMKNPYYDYQGKKKVFSKVLEEKNAYTMDEIFDMLDAEKGEPQQDEVVFNNYFQEPEKPYFFWVYESMGEHPIDETTRVEQVLEFQDSINESGAIIQDMNIRSRGKDIFDTNAIPQETLDNIDIYDVDQVLGLDVPQGKSIRDSHSRIDQSPATPQMYRSMQENRQKGFEMLAVGATTRGIQESDSTLGESQMAREADYGVIDDIVEDTINACAEWQARWSMQFIKLFYNKPHLRHILGKDGEVLHVRLSRDAVEDGMEAVVSASGVDKMQRKRMAIENMKLGIGDPLTFYEDTEQSNPKERALRAFLSKMAPQMYIQQYLMDSAENPGEQQNPMTQEAMAAAPGGQQPPAQPQAPMV